MSIVTLSGSPAATSKSHLILRHIGQSLRAAGRHVTEVAVRDLPAQALLSAHASDDALRSAIAQVAQARALVVATPIYKAAYSGVLKVFLDLLPQDALAGKIVLPLATGGSLAHALALDYALKPVLSALGARHQLASIHIVDQQIRFDGEHLVLDAAAQARIDDGVDALLEALPPASNVPLRHDTAAAL